MKSIKVIDALDLKFFASFEIRGIHPGNGEHITFPPFCICCCEPTFGHLEIHELVSKSQNFGNITKKVQVATKYQFRVCEYCQEHFEKNRKRVLLRTILRFATYFLPVIAIILFVMRAYEPSHTGFYQVSFWLGVCLTSIAIAGGIALYILSRRWQRMDLELQDSCTTSLNPVEVSFDAKLADVHDDYVPARSTSHLSISGLWKNEKYLRELRRLNEARIVAQIDSDELSRLE